MCYRCPVSLFRLYFKERMCARVAVYHNLNIYIFYPGIIYDANAVVYIRYISNIF